MKCICESETENTAVVAESSEVVLPMGLLGFEQSKDYLLLANPDEEPFGWLQMKENPKLAFVVIDPFLIAPEYKPEIPQADVEFLELERSEDAAVFNIVTIHTGNRATANLKGPIVINRYTRVGKQVVIANAQDYSVQHPVKVEASLT